MIKKTFADLLASLGRKIAVSPLLTSEQQTEHNHAKCRRRGYHQYQNGSCNCGAHLKPLPPVL